MGAGLFVARVGIRAACVLLLGPDAQSKCWFNNPQDETYPVVQSFPRLDRYSCPGHVRFSR